MRHSFRKSTLAACAMIGLTGSAALAASSAAGDPTAASSPAVAKATSTDGRETGVTVEQRIKDLHAKLLITPAQEPLWDRFAQVMRDNARNMEQTFHQRVNTMPSLTAPENMQSYAQVTMNHAQDMQKLVPAFQALYDTMSDAQKKTADQVFRDDAHRGRPMKHG